ncbi:MAG: P-loop NTPase [Oscillospiraceae bacterium]|nr:P-loop NTPase [Oscillospiraceae bacterium]MBQ9696126.1 P-loop NTPase [Oscillospiraceae bacterium]MBR1457967.1 P-loop NTPase [Oscillospiraceae bacterium]MBR1897903.1 P-loop NTPase [Oscillospiraceae bacterium]
MAKNTNRIIAVTSGKGGTGKSSICYGIGYTLAKQGSRTLIIELDFGLRCLDIMVGMAGKVQYDLGDVLSGRKQILDAVVTVPSATNLNILCAPKDAFMKVTAEEVVAICREIRKYFDYIIIDTGAGISSHVFDIVEQSNMILVVTTPDPICIRDATMMSDEFYKRGNKRQRLIINKLSKKDISSGMISNLDDIIDTVGIQLLGVIPEDFALKEATGKGTPLPFNAPSLEAFDAISKRLMGEAVPLTIK